MISDTDFEALADPFSELSNEKLLAYAAASAVGTHNETLK